MGLYTSEGFLIAAKEYDSLGVKDEVIKEVGAPLVAQSALTATASIIVAAPGPEDDDEVYVESRKLVGNPTQWPRRQPRPPRPCP
jgi:hypothetical protein